MLLAKIDPNIEISLNAITSWRGRLQGLSNGIEIARPREGEMVQDEVDIPNRRPWPRKAQREDEHE